MPEQEIQDFQGEVLEFLDEAKGFLQWMFDQYSPYIQWGTIWELGSGHGSMCDFLLPAQKLILSEWDPGFRKHLEDRYVSKPHVEITPLDLEDLDVNRFKHFQLDTIISTNVLEHIKNHEEAFRRITSLMNDNTVMITLVPAHMWLYGEIDKRFGHFRRYTKKSLTETLEGAGQRVEQIIFFNRASCPVWFFRGRILGKNTLERSDMKKVEAILPILKLIDKAFPFPFGQSIIAISKLK